MDRAGDLIGWDYTAALALVCRWVGHVSSCGNSASQKSGVYAVLPPRWVSDARRPRRDG